MTSAVAHKGSFLPFLPQDAVGDGSNAAAEEVVSLISQDLAALLRTSTDQFWDTLQHDTSLQTCLDTYLQHCRRPYDGGGGGGSGASAARQQLARRVFVVLMRIVQTAEQEGPSGPRAQLLLTRQLLSLPTLMDVCVLYGAENPEMMQQLLSQVFTVVPQLAGNLQDLSVQVTENLQSVCEACLSNARQLDGSPQAVRVAESLVDGIMYMRDVCLTLAAFLAASPAAGPLLLGSDTGLMSALAGVHDEFVPRLLSAAGRAPDVSVEPYSKMRMLLQHVELASEHLSFLLLQCSFLQQHPPLPLAGGKAAAARSPTMAGEGLVSALIAIGQESSAAPASGRQTGLLAALTQQRSLPGVIAAAVTTGNLTLDDAQRDYLHALMGEPVPVMQSAAAPATGAEHSAGAAVSDVDAAVMESYLSQIKELLPGYGDGYLAACLQAFSFDTEQVINTLLEGNLPPELSALDPQTPLSGAAGPSIGPGSSSAAVGVTEGLSNISLGGLSWTGLREDADAGSAAPGHVDRGNKRGVSGRESYAGNRAHRATARILDSMGDQRDAILRTAAETQWEYDDEYDDSFDAMTGGGNDGIADVEGDDDERRAGGAGYSGGRGGAGAGGRGDKTKLWIHAGRVYNYNPKKEGTQEVRSHAEAERAVKAAADAANTEVHGLGRGGNVPYAPPGDESCDGEGGDNMDARAGLRTEGGRGAGDGGGRGGGGGGRGRGRGYVSVEKRDKLHKDHNKSAIGNHNRKDRAAKKAGFL